MPHSMRGLIDIFDSRLATLDALITAAKTQIGEEKATALLGSRLAPDMFPLGRQISITGNMPNQFALWCADQEISTTDTDIMTLPEAHAHIAGARNNITAITADDSKFNETKQMSLPGNITFRLSGREYADQWVLPNFYFHLVTSYNLFRANGIEIGKKDYMAHLMPTIMQQMAAAQAS